MRTLDETDREILRLLLSDARRPYSDIDDRELSTGLETLVTLRPAPSEATRVYDALADHDRVEHAFLTADGDVDLAVDCVECDNTVTAEGESARIDGTLYHFCCGSCRGRFEQRYERLEEGA